MNAAAGPTDCQDPDPGGITGRLSQLVDGQLTAYEIEQLEEQLLQDPALLAEYCDFLDTEFMLAWELKCRGASDLGSQVRHIAPPSALWVPLSPRAAAWIIPLLLVGAGCLAAWGLTARGLVTARPSEAGRAAAVLSRADAAVWKAKPALSAGRPLPAGPLALVEGAAQLSFASGAIVAVQAPSEFEVLGPNRLLLRQGRIAPFVPEKAKGFTVVSPTGEVVDLGTEFSVSVGHDGTTNVFVIDGEVDVGQGQLAADGPIRLTQGFASTTIAGGTAPQVTQRPILMERFAAPSMLFCRVGPTEEAHGLIMNGELRIPIESRPEQKDPTVQVLLDHDLSAMVGRRSTISYKISLPPAASLTKHRWAGLVIDPGDGPLPWAHKPGAAASVLISPYWQVGLSSDGKVIRQKAIWPRQTVFPRGSDAVGPYQVVIAIDDTPSARARLGGCAFDVMVNGVEFVRDYPIQLGTRPRLAFQTFLSREFYGRGYAAVDDFSVSVEGLPETEAY